MGTGCRVIAIKTVRKKRKNNAGSRRITPATPGTGGQRFNHYAVDLGKSSAWKLN